MTTISLEDAMKGRGGRIEYIYHVSGYPWAVSTSKDVVTAFNAGTTMANAARRRLFGTAEYNGELTTVFAEDQTLCQIFPTLQPPGSQTVQADESRGLKVGGWDVKIADIEPGFDWYHTNGDIWGLDGLHRVAQPRVDSSIYWGILNTHLEVGDSTFKVEEASGTNLHTKIQAAEDDGIFLWIGQECIYVTGSSNASGITTITIPDSGGEGRGCFRSREQNFYLESYGNTAMVVTDAPMSIIDKPCWLWAVLFDDEGNMLLDMTGSTINSGMVLIRHGKVSSGVETKKGISRVKCHGALKSLDNDVKISHFAGGALSRYYLYRNSKSGTEMDIGPGGSRSSVMKYMQAPHMVIQEFDAENDTDGDIRCIWLCEQEDTEHFNTSAEVIDALNVELSRCASKGIGTNNDYYEDQLSGDSNSVGVENERTDLSYNYVVSYDGTVTQTKKTGGDDVEKPSVITGVLPWLLNLGGIFKRIKPGATAPVVDDLKDEAIEVLEDLKTDHTSFFCYAYGSTSHWRICQTPGFIGYAWRGVFLKPWDAWVSPYYYEYGINDPDDVATWDGAQRANLHQSTFPLLSSSTNITLTHETDTTGLGSGDVLTLGGRYTMGGFKRVAQASVISVNATGYYPIIGINSGELTNTGQELKPFKFGTGLFYFPSLYADLDTTVDITNNNRGSIEQSSNDWTSELIDSSDPWRISTVFDGSSQTLSPIFKALLGGSGIDIHENYVMRQIVGFIEEGDFKSTIDWDNFNEMIEPICPGHRYNLLLDDTINLYNLLEQECLIHGLVPTWEWSVDDYQFVMRFRHIGPMNMTDAIWSGRAINESHILQGTSPTESHNDTWLYNKMKIKCNYDEGEAKKNFTVEYNSGHAANRETSKTLNIDAQLSFLPGLGNTSTATSVKNHFVDNMLVHLAEAQPVQRTQTNITRLFDIGAGQGFNITDRSAHKPYTHEIGLTSQPAWATRVKCDLGRMRMGITYRLTDNVSYGWAPALQVPASSSTVESGYIQCSPSAHTFSPSDARLDVSWFDCLDYNKSTGNYTARDCSCGNYAVYAFNPELATIVLMSFTAQSISTTNNTIRLYGTTTGWNIALRHIVIFQEIDNCEDCQKNFVFQPDSNNTLADGSLPPRWI